MHLIKVIPHGPLRVYEAFAIAADTAAEAIEGWSRQAGIKGRPQVEVVGFETDQSLYDPTEVIELHVVPSMFGGGGKFASIIIGAVEIVAGVIIGGPLGLALVVAGIGTMIAGIINLFMKSPSLSKQEDPEASKYIGGGKNTTAIGTLIGIGGGRMKIGGQYLSLQVNATDLVYGRFPATPS